MDRKCVLNIKKLFFQKLPVTNQIMFIDFGAINIF